MNLLSLGNYITKLPAIIRFGEIEEKDSEDETYTPPLDGLTCWRILRRKTLKRSTLKMELFLMWLRPLGVYITCKNDQKRLCDNCKYENLHNFVKDGVKNVENVTL